MKYMIKVISALAFIGSVLWFYQVGGWEPIVAALTALGALVSLIVTDRSSGRGDLYKTGSDSQTDTLKEENTQVVAPITPIITSLSGKVDMNVPRGTIIEVFYKKPFKRIPYLAIERFGMLGMLEIVEQRADGFKIKSPDFDKISIKWSAEGEFEE